VARDAAAEALAATERRLAATSAHTTARVGDLEERVVTSEVSHILHTLTRES